MMEAANRDRDWKVYKPPVLQDPVLDDLNIGWKLDYLVETGGTDYPLEVKAIHPRIWDRLNTIDDFHTSTSRFTRRYPGQLMLYMLRRGRDRGVFYLVNGLTWKPKTIWVDLDYDYAEGLLKRAAAVNQHIKDGTLPPLCEETEFCPTCDFFHVCLPDLKEELQDDLIIIGQEGDLFGAGPQGTTTRELFVQYFETLADYKLNRKAYRLLRERLKERPRVIIEGLFMSESAERSRRGFKVKPSTFRTVKFKKLQNGDA